MQEHKSAATSTGRVAIVTGAGQGVGRGIALALAVAGARVALMGRTVAKVESVAAEIEGCGGVALAVGGGRLSRFRSTLRSSCVLRGYGGGPTNTERTKSMSSESTAYAQRPLRVATW